MGTAIRLFVALAILGIVSGCTHHHRASRGTLDAAARSGRAYRTDGSRIYDREPWLAADLYSVVRVSRGRGAIEGLGIGALSGAAVGGLIGYAAGDDDCETSGFLCFSAGDKAKLTGLLFGGVGAAAGLVIGAIAGSKEILQLELAEHAVRFTVTPQRTAGLSIDF